MIRKQYILECDKCGEAIEVYHHYKPSITQIRKVAGQVRINNGCMHVICKDCILAKLLGKEIQKPDCIYSHTPNKPQITIGTKIRSKANPDIILSIISNDCHEDEFECSNGSVLSLKQIEKYYDIIIV